MNRFELDGAPLYEALGDRALERSAPHDGIAAYGHAFAREMKRDPAGARVPLLRLKQSLAITLNAGMTRVSRRELTAAADSVTPNLVWWVHYMGAFFARFEKNHERVASELAEAKTAEGSYPWAQIAEIEWAAMGVAPDVYLALYEEAAAMRPFAGPLRDRLCDIYRDIGDRRKAFVQARTAAWLHPSARVLLRFALAAWAVEAYGDSIDAFEDASALEPTDARYDVFLADLFIHLNEGDEARRAAKRAAEKAPLDVDCVRVVRESENVSFGERKPAVESARIWSRAGQFDLYLAVIDRVKFPT